MTASAKLLLLGFVIVLGLGIALLKLMGGGDPATASTNRRANDSATATPPDPKTRAEDRLDHRPAADPPGGATSAPAKPSIVFQRPFVSNDELVPRDERGLAIPILNKPEVGTANTPTDDNLRECLVKTGFAGSGTAVLTFIIARKKDKDGERIATEDSGFEETGTTLTDATLLECMHKTAFHMQFPPPKPGVAIWGKRKIRIEDGMLRENSIIDIGRIR